MKWRLCGPAVGLYISLSVFSVPSGSGYLAPLAQLDRVLAFEAKGWGFESLGVHH